MFQLLLSFVQLHNPLLCLTFSLWPWKTQHFTPCRTGFNPDIMCFHPSPNLWISSPCLSYLPSTSTLRRFYEWPFTGSSLWYTAQRSRKSARMLRHSECDRPKKVWVYLYECEDVITANWRKRETITSKLVDKGRLVQTRSLSDFMT